MITVDPARRLRDALGLERLTAQPTRIDSRRLATAGLDPRLKLWAMVLDVKGAWDSLIARFRQNRGSARTDSEKSFLPQSHGTIRGR